MPASCTGIGQSGCRPKLTCSLLRNTQDKQWDQVRKMSHPPPDLQGVLKHKCSEMDCDWLRRLEMTKIKLRNNQIKFPVSDHCELEFMFRNQNMCYRYKSQSSTDQQCDLGLVVFLLWALWLPHPRTPALQNEFFSSSGSSPTTLGWLESNFYCMFHMVVDPASVPKRGLVKADREGTAPASSFIIFLHPVPQLRKLPNLCWECLPLSPLFK